MVSELSLNGHGGPSVQAASYAMPDAGVVRIRLTAGECPAHPNGVRCSAAKYAGAVAVFRRGASVAEALEWERLRRGGEPLALEMGAEAAQITLWEDLRRMAERYLIAWNLRERHLDPDEPETVDADGVPGPNWVCDGAGAPLWFPVPATAEALLRQPADFGQELYWRYWMEVAGLSDPLALPSSGPSPSPEPSTPKAAKSSRRPGSSSAPESSRASPDATDPESSQPT